MIDVSCRREVLILAICEHLLVCLFIQMHHPHSPPPTTYSRTSTQLVGIAPGEASRHSMERSGVHIPRAQNREGESELMDGYSEVGRINNSSKITQEGMNGDQLKGVKPINQEQGV